MLLHPEVQAKAQSQIDDVVGNDRLPEFADIDRLPYIQAIIKELFRWQPVTPLGGQTLAEAFEPQLTSRNLIQRWHIG